MLWSHTTSATIVTIYAVTSGGCPRRFTGGAILTETRFLMISVIICERNKKNTHSWKWSRLNNFCFEFWKTQVILWGLSWTSIGVPMIFAQVFKARMFPLGTPDDLLPDRQQWTWINQETAFLKSLRLVLLMFSRFSVSNDCCKHEEKKSTCNKHHRGKVHNHFILVAKASG